MEQEIDFLENCPSTKRYVGVRGATKTEGFHCVAMLFGVEVDYFWVMT